VVGEDLGRELSARYVMFHQAIAQRLGLNVTDHKCSELLVRMGPMTAGELARETGLTTGAITGVVNRLEKAGYVARTADPDDRRRVIVQPIDNLERSLEARLLFEPFGRSVGKLMAHYNESERALIANYLKSLVGIMREETLKLREHHKKKGK
jgi:DNA-binding MarR family transcriptional regulator